MGFDTRISPTNPDLESYDRGVGGIEEQVQTGLNLFLPLKNPMQMGALLKLLEDKKKTVQEALQGLHYVHFARFLPSLDSSTLMVITEFDGDLKSYIMDFVAVLGDIFTAILDFVQDAPPLPVQKYPDEFWKFIKKYNVEKAKTWSAYKDMTVIAIQTAGGVLISKDGKHQNTPKPVPRIDLKDIQGNILKGYRVELARHFLLKITNSRETARFITSLTPREKGDDLQVTTAEHWEGQDRPEYCLNIGFTWNGLRELGLPPSMLAQFPEAFREGPHDPERAKKLGDIGDSAPDKWKLGGPDVHLVVSLYANAQSTLKAYTNKLVNLFLNGLSELSRHDAKALPDGRVHFGYKDGISQPRIAGVHYKNKVPDMQPLCSPGEFLLGKNYINQYGGNFLGNLPSRLGDNATYGAFCLLQQDVFAFEQFIEDVAQVSNMYKELIAAKLMGRWRNGVPLVISPDTDTPSTGIDPKNGNELNNFDYVSSPEYPTFYDDSKGVRCPIGSHIRRLNPRGALVMGKPHSRRIIRRGMPYGPKLELDTNHKLVVDDIERGLVGYFICGDLEMQFEFLLETWANKDIATAGIRDTRDPILGAQSRQDGKFIIRTNDARDPIVLYDLPRFVITRGRVYAFIPGIGGLRFLASVAAGSR